MLPRGLLAALAGLLLGAPAAPAAAWVWPLDGTVVERFDYGPDPFRRGQHRGIDIAAAVGTPVRSACSGRVRFAGVAPRAGRTVSVACGELTATYLHLDSISVEEGDALRAGQRLGAAGVSGAPGGAGPHLHFGVRRSRRRLAYVDPLSLLGERPGVGGAPVVALRRVPIGPARPGAGPRLGPAPEPRPVTVRVPSPTAAPARSGVPIAADGRLVAGESRRPGWVIGAGIALLALAVRLPVVRARWPHVRAEKTPAATATLRRGPTFI